jgi:hypothetical protein
MRKRMQRLVAGPADGRALKAEIGVLQAAERQRPAHVVEAVDMLVERGRADAETPGEAGEGDRLESIGIGNRFGGIDEALAREAAAGHFKAY